MVEERRLRLVQTPRDDADVRARAAALLRFYKAKADECEWIARQISLMPDRQYFLSCARELRAKAAALESGCA